MVTMHYKGTLLWNRKCTHTAVSVTVNATGNLYFTQWFYKQVFLKIFSFVNFNTYSLETMLLWWFSINSPYGKHSIFEDALK